jgi:hypothetical protein
VYNQGHGRFPRWLGTPNTAAASRNGSTSPPGAATVRALLKAGADPALTDAAGRTTLDYARRKLARLQARPRRVRKSPAPDENDQLQLSEDEQPELDRMRKELGEGDDARDYLRVGWQERLRAARRVFNDADRVEQIVAILEGAAGER